MPKKEIETVEQDTVESAPVDTQDIVVGDPQLLRPSELPLVVKLPEGASEAQIEYAKKLNAYAYQNPKKWEQKKDALIEKLKSLKTAPPPQVGNLRINNSGL
jgi:hypothetical protein